MEQKVFAEKCLRKHVAIIHAYSMMSVLQRKIFNVLLYNAFEHRKEFEENDSVALECNMQFSNLSKAINFNSNNTQYLKNAIDGLASLKIEWNLLQDKAPTDISFLNLRVLHGSPTFYHDGGFSFSFHKVMLDLVGNPAIYGTIDLDVQSKFESKYGHSLYENSTRFVNLHRSKIIHLDTFRKILGVQENKYSSIRELTRNVIRPSIEEVNDRAGFVVNIKNIKSGKKTTGFELTVEGKSRSVQKKETIKAEVGSEIYEAISVYFGKINLNVFNNILKNYPEPYIWEKISYTKKHANKEKTGLYPLPYLISAIKNNYQSSEQQNSIENVPVLPTKSIWEYKFDDLHSDVYHWEEQLDRAMPGKNLSYIGHIEKMLLQSKEALRKHILEKPNVDLKIGDGI